LKNVILVLMLVAFVGLPLVAFGGGDSPPASPKGTDLEVMRLKYDVLSWKKAAFMCRKGRLAKEIEDLDEEIKTLEADLKKAVAVKEVNE